MAMVKLGDVAIEKRETWTGSTQGVPIIGLEHLVPGEITLSLWDSDTDNTFSKMFRKDQVLLGRRRVYLKKAVIAPFDGICSGDITVIEAIPGKISPRLLPFIIQNERFFDYAIQGSAGSLSPRVKWEHLKDYEFNLSDYEEQESLANKLWSALKLKESYHALLLATDEMVKSRFIEDFYGKGYPSLSLNSFSKVVTGSTPSRSINEYWFNGSHPWVSAQDMGEKFVDSTAEFITDSGMATCKSIPAGSLLYVCRGSIGVMSINRIDCATNQSICSAIPDSSICKTEYLYYWLLYHEDEITSLGEGTSFKSLSQKTFANLEIQLPPIKEQLHFITLTQQADKSKFELKQAIEKIDKVMRALLQ